jgi:hypothetical protein
VAAAQGNEEEDDMFLTPTNTGNAVAGVGIGVFSWSVFLKIDKIPGLKRLVTTKRRDNALGWMNKNKGIAFLGLEALNLAVHNPFTPDGVMFASGNTIVNAIMMWIFLPIRMMRSETDHTQAVLRGKA